MKKRRLDVEFTYDFELLGLTSSVRGYKLAWEINRVAGINLVRMEDLKIVHRDITYTFSFFSHESSVNVVKLFKNKSNETEGGGHFIVPEHSHSDYILYSKGDESVESKRLQELLRNIPSIELVAFLPLAALKSKDNFIF